MNNKRVAATVGAVGCFALAAGSVLLMLGLLLGVLLIAGSERTVYERAKSPDGWHEARVQFDDAGAVSRFARLVFIKHSWNLSDEPLLSCRAFWGDGEAEVHLKWLDDSTLLIEHHFAPNSIESVARNCGPVKIITRAVPPFEKD